jgi:hypothetical protein
MKYLKIQNDGLLDIRLVALMGGSTKSNDKFKIGQFGTGLKYTLAFLFRNNLSFKLFVGSEEVVIQTETEVIKDDEFEIICINGQRTSITTRMGEDWEAWMIVRELWCNALDEGGSKREVTTTALGEAGKTTFYIQVDKQIESVLKNWNKYFIHDQEAIFQNNNVALYPAGDHLCIYKQGVLIYENEQHKSVFSYDLKDADINELREYRGSPSMAIVHCLADANEKSIQHFLENVSEEHFEGCSSMDYNWYRSFSKTWKTVIGNAKIISDESLSQLKERGSDIDESTVVIVPNVLYKFLTKQFDGIGALYVAGISASFYENYSLEIENKIKQGLTILEECGYVMHPELEFVYGFFEDKRILAQVSMKEKKIFISQQLLQRPLFDIVATLIEENEHFNTGMEDHTREFQQHFIDLYARQLLATNSIEI